MVLDTHVLVSGIYFTGPPRKILRRWVEGAFDLVVSAEILEEYRRVVSELSSGFTTVDPARLLEFVTVNAFLAAMD